MSRKMPYYSLDKVAATISIDAKARVKWENRAKAKNQKVTTFIAIHLEEVVRNDPFTLEDLERQNQLIRENAARRELKKKAKGIK